MTKDQDRSKANDDADGTESPNSPEETENGDPQTGGEGDSRSEEIRDRAQSLRKDLAEEVHAPAEQDDHAAARKHSADEDEE